MCEKPKFRIENNILIGGKTSDVSDCRNIGELIIESLKKRPKFMVQIDPITRTHNTAEDVYKRSVKCAIWLKRQGVEAGDIVGICLDNDLNVCVPVLGILYLSAINSPWDHDITKRSARYYLKLISPKLVFISAAYAKNMQEAAKEEKKDIKIVTVGKADGFESLDDILASVDDSEIDHFKCTPVNSPDDTIVISCSSGTTGLPKGAELSHRSMLYILSAKQLSKSATPIVTMWLTTIRWHAGLVFLIRPFLFDTRAVIIPDISDDFAIFEYIDKYKVTQFVSDPAVAIRWVKLGYQHRYPLKTLKTYILAGACCDAQKQREISQAYPHVKVLLSYGTTDCGGKGTFQSTDSKPGSCGFICTDQMMKFVDGKTGAALGPNKVGEIYIKSPYIMTRYHNNPEATKKAITDDGWLRTNDLGYYDEDGEVFFSGRISEFINYRSINLSPMEIESVLESHPSVMKAVVVPVADEIEEEHPMAFIMKVPGKEVTVEEIMKLVEENLSWYCELRGGIKFIEKMPRTATGKIARKELKEMANRK